MTVAIGSKSVALSTHSVAIGVASSIHTHNMTTYPPKFKAGDYVIYRDEDRFGVTEYEAIVIKHRDYNVYQIEHRINGSTTKMIDVLDYDLTLDRGRKIREVIKEL